MLWRSLCALALVVCALSARAQEPIRFGRTPDISPDGKLVAFSYLGDIWTVETIGGVARPVTMHEAHEIYPMFSPDGKWLAFSSDRHGSYDVFVVPVRGGRPKRLTFDSAADFVVGWSPDSSNVLFQSTRSTAYPPGPTLYKVPLEGGAETPLPFGDAKDIAMSPRGDQVAYVRGPGTWYRKGYRGSSNDDIWLANPDGTNHRQLTNFNGQDSCPMWSPDGTRLYFVSEQFGPANICYVDVGQIAAGTVMGKPTQFTKHTDDTVRHARLSGNGEWLVYECGADLWVAGTHGSPPRKLAIEVYADDKTNTEKLTTFTSGITQFTPSPDEKGFAIVVHGEIFYMPAAGGKATRLTDNPAYDHGVSWAPDGKKLIFLSDRGGRDGLYLMESDDPEHAEIATAVKVKTKPLVAPRDASIGAADYSPDGKKIAFVRSGKLFTVNADGAGEKAIVDQQMVVDFDWSPDSKWLVYARMDGSFGNELYIIPSAGGKAENVTRYATTNLDVTWSQSGMKLAFISERAGPNGMQMRPFVLPLQKPAAPGTPTSSDIDFDDIHLRAVEVAPFPASAAAISNDGNRIAFRNGDDLWVVNSDGSNLTRMTSGRVKPEFIRWSKKYTSVFFLDGNGQIRVARPGFGATGDPSPIAFSAKMTVRRDELYAEMFEQSWRYLADSFYDPQFHHVDWNAVHAKYQPLVKHVGARADLYALIELMLGELNASHLGIAGPRQAPEEITADLGLLLDETYRGPGKKIAEVLKHGPADKRGINIKAGDVITAIDREPITEKSDLSKMLNGKVNENVQLELLAAGAADPKDPKAKRRVEIQGISRYTASNLMYERWCEHNAKIVAEKSGGKFGYIHIPGMDQPGLDRFVRALYSDHFDKEAIVLDVRYNGGGYTHDQVLSYLTGKEHTIFKQRNGGDGLVLRAGDRKWTKPLVLLINNQSYSDAEIFPSAFRTQGLGKLVGQQTGGMVIGTGGVTLVDGSILRLPRIGVYSVKGVNMEREGVMPDVTVEPTPEDLVKGRDPQLEKAIEVVKTDVAVWKKAHGIPTTSAVAADKPGAPPATGPVPATTPTKPVTAPMSK
jgi:tricorn protease